MTPLSAASRPHVFRAGPDGAWTWAGASWSRATGLPPPLSLGRGWLQAVHVDDRRRLVAAFRDGEASDLVEAEARLLLTPSEHAVRMTLFAEAERDPETGELSGWTGSWLPAAPSPRRLEEDGQRLAEMEHRVRNTLAVVRSIARRSAESADTAESLAMHFDGRLAAYARVQAALMRQPNLAMPMEMLLRDQLHPVVGRREDRLRIGGAPVRAKAKAAELFGLMFHELATNALKFGPLSGETGWIEASWDVRDERLVIHWRESGEAVETSPARAGFGMSFLKGTLAYEAGAEAQFSAHPAGIEWRVEVPLGGPLGGQILV